MEQQVELNPLHLRLQEEVNEDFEDDEFEEGFGEDDNLDLGLDEEEEY